MSAQHLGPWRDWLPGTLIMMWIVIAFVALSALGIHACRTPYPTPDVPAPFLSG